MSIVPRFTYGALDLTEYPFSVEFGSDFGNPENVVDVVQTLLHDGEVLESNRRTNRTLTIPVMIDDADMLALAAAEAQLIAECDKPRNALAVEPGDGIGATTVFETFRAQPRWIRSDDEERGGVRRYVLEIPALPHPRSVDKFTDESDTPASTGTVVDACDSATGWAVAAGGNNPATVATDTTHKVQGTASVKIEAERFTAVTNSSGQTIYQSSANFSKTGLTLDTDLGGYVSVALRMEWPGGAGSGYESQLRSVTMTSVENGAELVSFFASTTMTDGFVRYAWLADPALTVTGLTFAVVQHKPHYTTAPGVPVPSFDPLHVWVDDVMFSESATTDHQIVKAFDVGGSARAPGSLHVMAPDEGVALGEVFALTVHADAIAPGFQPDVRRWLTSGSSTVSAPEPLHGSFFAMFATYSSSPVFEVPAAMLLAGPYQVVAAVSEPTLTTLTLSCEAQLVAGGVAVGPVSEASLVTTNDTASGYRFVTLGTVNLPPVQVANPNSNAVVRLRFKGSTSARLSDAFLVPDVADLTIADCGDGTVSASGASSHLWIDSPSPEQPRGGYWVGPVAGRINARSLSLVSDLRKGGRHIFSPGRMYAFVASMGAQGPRVYLEGYHHWFGNAGD